jgi:hypothetical protein
MRIKILRNIPGHALVQMGDGFQAELAVHFLKVCFMNTLVIHYCDIFTNMKGYSCPLLVFMHI